jgi:hypothetical protein
MPIPACLAPTPGQGFFPTGGAEPPGSGSSKPDRFNREPEKTR